MCALVIASLDKSCIIANPWTFRGCRLWYLSHSLPRNITDRYKARRVFRHQDHTTSKAINGTAQCLHVLKLHVIRQFVQDQNVRMLPQGCGQNDPPQMQISKKMAKWQRRRSQQCLGWKNVKYGYSMAWSGTVTVIFIRCSWSSLLDSVCLSFARRNLPQQSYMNKSTSQQKLVGGWATPLKNISQLGLLFPIYGKIKNVPNHQPEKSIVRAFHMLHMPAQNCLVASGSNPGTVVNTKCKDLRVFIPPNMVSYEVFTSHLTSNLSYLLFAFYHQNLKKEMSFCWNQWDFQWVSYNLMGFRKVTSPNEHPNENHRFSPSRRALPVVCDQVAHGHLTSRAIHLETAQMLQHVLLCQLLPRNDRTVGKFTLANSKAGTLHNDLISDIDP